jgi:hypothetical protein
MAQVARTARHPGLLLWLLLLLAGCAHDVGSLPPEERLPAPGDPAYTETVLARRADALRSIRSAQLSLENIQYLIGVGQGREIGGSPKTFRDQTDLYRMRMDRELDLMRARGALARLERQVRQDHGGELPAWWPRD